MEQLFNLPTQAYDYVYYNYGYVGLLISGLGLVVGTVSFFIFLDRRR